MSLGKIKFWVIKEITSGLFYSYRESTMEVTTNYFTFIVDAHQFTKELEVYNTVYHLYLISQNLENARFLKIQEDRVYPILNPKFKICSVEVEYTVTPLD